MKKRTIALLLAFVLVLGAAIGGTLAYLLDQESVTNTFTVGGIEIELTETPNTDSNDADTEPDVWTAQLIPGKTYAKDPKVTVVAADTNIDCYLFVKVKAVNNTFKDAAEANQPILKYDLSLDDTDSGWTKGDGTNIPSNVWYRTVTTSTADQSWNILNGEGTGELKNGKVTINDELTKGTMPEGNATPSLTFTAYAIQKAGFATAADAWQAGNFQ